MTKQLETYNGKGGIWSEDVQIVGSFTASSSVKVLGILMVGGDVTVNGELEAEKLLCAGRVKCSSHLKTQRTSSAKSIQTGVFDIDDFEDFSIGLTD